MFARVKKSGKYQYLQIVENRKIKGKVKQRVISTIGRMDQLQAKGRVETLIKSLSRFSERTMLILSGQSNDAGHVFEWADIKRDLKALQLVTIEESGKRFAIWSQCLGTCGKIFQAVKVAFPPTIREVT